MKVDTRIMEEGAAPAAGNAHLLGRGFEGLEPYLQKSRDLRQALVALGKMGDKSTNRTARRLHHQLKHAEPSVTMIGQVKAGKTSLVNAMVGFPDLLPADVNPWTSVVTSLHLNPHVSQDENRASFRFFDMEEWSRLLDRGGRIGELAARAGAEDELEKVREQVIEMREKSRERLGDKFELLLGQQHDYGYFDNELIERYVCLGDDFEDDFETSQAQGRFADITKSAEIFMHRPEMPMPLCIRDTPGVNDTFMIREQITIRAIRESRICVVVLAAHQALSSVDMALIRLIANVKSREVIIAVNRCDELSDPLTQIPQIRNSIRKTLSEHDGPKDAQIIFSSAYCATAALTGNIDAIDAETLEALTAWAVEDGRVTDPDALTPEELLWDISGLPSIYAALSERISDGAGQDMLDRIAKSAMNLANGLNAAHQVVSRRESDIGLPPLEKGQLESELKRIEADSIAAMNAAFETTIQEFQKRLERSHRSFLERATGSLLKHLEENGESEVWEYDPSGLRILLRTAYQVFGRKAQKTTKDLLIETAETYASVYFRLFDVAEEDFGIEAPTPPSVPSPVLLGQTIALDLKGTWWSRWWHKRRGFRSFATEFADMIKSETDPIVESLSGAHAESIREASLQELREFMAEQRLLLTRLSEEADNAPGGAAALLDAEGTAIKRAQLKQTMATLTEIAA
ncbi:dynamin family protein [Boseongicola aestuarii]|uniref:GTP-binding protein Der n=1 Tax=Boseongicola aestuarii TaxID=1470561 RepID=A0A238IXW5_9RHOB|nr:dynamin family protein [Boseongicola aestuarii]SMX23329.1 GTP-binding protein Der [Boseongicola aestuarii]